MELMLTGVYGVMGFGFRYCAKITKLKSWHVRPLCFEALGIPFQLCGTSDINEAFRKVVERNYSSTHRWADMKDQVNHLPCVLHPRRQCNMSPQGMELDIWIMGTPCPPFSEQNPQRNVEGAVERHPLYHITFEHAVAAVQEGHRAYLIEQVPGFAKPYHPGTDITPMQKFFA